MDSTSLEAVPTMPAPVPPQSPPAVRRRADVNRRNAEAEAGGRKGDPESFRGPDPPSQGRDTPRIFTHALVPMKPFHALT